MNNLTRAYHGHFMDVHGETPEERVQDFLAGDATEAHRAIASFEAVLQRSDLPTAEEILAADLEQQSHRIREACLLGADLAQARDADSPLSWSDDLVRRWVAFRLTHGTDQGQGWYALLAERRPRLVADVLCSYARQCLLQRAGMSITGLWPLARDDAQGELARLVVPDLLKSFPERARPAQLRRLNSELVPAAIRHLPPDALRAVVTERLEMACIDSGQRIAWLLAGLRFAPHRRSGDLFRLVRASRVRTQRLAETIDAQADHAKALPALPAAAWARLIEVLAPGASPEFPLGAEWVGASQRRRDLVRGMIDRLSASPDAAASEELECLRQLPLLQAWRIALDAGRYEQARLARASRFEHASAAAVVASLSGAAPANALDLAALALQHLGDAQDRIRGGESNFLRTFWRTDSKGRPTPQVENACRDLLLTLLRPEFVRAGVTLNKEAQHADDTRADLRAEALVDGRLRVVPIEIKRENHKNVWTAWDDQLDGQYTTHPDAEGVGIYLVLWFGHHPRSDTTRTRPANALDMQERLIALIPAADRARLTVRVLDLSLLRPPSARGKRSNR